MQVQDARRKATTWAVVVGAVTAVVLFVPMFLLLAQVLFPPGPFGGSDAGLFLGAAGLSLLIGIGAGFLVHRGFVRRAANA